MALKNNEGNYLKIDNVYIFNEKIIIEYSIFADTETRVWGLKTFQKAITDRIIIEDNFIFNQDFSKNQISNLKCGGYLTLKANGFADWIDC